tara:strand:+ start:465 stop:668 length:204 start_codon:yes stop_codon:yes gene_type:complete
LALPLQGISHRLNSCSAQQDFWGLTCNKSNLTPKLQHNFIKYESEFLGFKYGVKKILAICYFANFLK